MGGNTCLRGQYVVVLDEVNVTISFELLAVEVLDFLDQQPEHVELILTGRTLYRAESKRKMARPK